MHVRRVQEGEDLLSDLEFVRQLWNQESRWMTGPQKHISREGQAWWWNDRPRALYIVEGAGYFLLTKKADDKMWVSLGVSRNARNRGIGTEIYKIARDMIAPITVWAEIFSHNGPSLAAARKAAYEFSSEEDGKVVMHS